MLEQKNIFNYNDRKILLLCHPRSGSSYLAREFYNSIQINQQIHPEFLHLPGKNEHSFTHFTQNTNMKFSYYNFLELSPVLREKHLKQEFFRLIKRSDPIILKLFFRIRPSLFSLTELESIKVDHNLMFVKLIRKNLLSGFLSHAISAATGIWMSDEKLKEASYHIKIDRKTIKNKLLGFFENFQNDIHMSNDSLVDQFFIYEDIENAKDHTLFNTKNTLNKTRSCVKMNTESEKLLFLENNKWLKDFFHDALDMFNIEVDDSFNLIRI